MFTFIEAINFQRHKHTRLDLSDGVNAFIGDSDAGKSSIFRLVHWIAFNRPLGDEFISHWADTAEGRIGLTEGPVVGRVRGKAGNYYYIDWPDRKREEFKAPGSGPPPDAITKLLNIDAINFQGQMAGPFLLGDSPPEVARFLNRIVDLEVIDKSLTMINSRLRRENADRDKSIILAEQAEADLARYDWLDRAEADLRAVEIIDASRKKVSQSRGSLREQLGALNQMEIDLDESSRIVATMDRGVRGLEKEYGAIRDRQARYGSLLDQHDGLLALEVDLIKAQKILRHDEELARMEALRAEIDGKTRVYNAMVDLYDETVMLDKDLATARVEVEKAHKEYEALAPDECPVCGTPKEEWKR